jgi:signal recognition particle receptor subunit alpha
VLDGLQDVLMARNVAAEPAAKICESIAQKLDGKVIGTFSRVSSLVKEAMDETLVQV